MARCSTAALIRAQQPGHWLTLNAWPAPAYRRALKALGVQGVSKMSKVEMVKTLRTLSQDEVLSVLGKRELTDAERDAAHDRLRKAGFL